MTPLQVFLCSLTGALMVVIKSSSEQQSLSLTYESNSDDAVQSQTLMESKGFDTSLAHIAKSHRINDGNSEDQNCSKVCNLTDRQMKCIDCLPRYLESKVNGITVSQFSKDNIAPYMFCGVSWPGVVNLTILNTKDRNFSISNFTFDCLPQIEILTLGLTGLESLEINAFHGLENTNTLDLSDCVYLLITRLSPSLLLFTNLPKLRNIVLRNLGTMDSLGVNQISQAFLDNAAQRKIVEVDFSFSTVGFENENVNISGVCNCIEKLILRNSRLINVNFAFPSACESLRVLDISGVSYPRLPIPVGNITLRPGVHKVNVNWMKALSNVSVLYLNKIISTDHFIFLNNVTLELQLENALTEVHFSGYNAPVFEVKFVLASNLLEYLDLSNNRIERLSPDSVSHLKNLKIMDLSKNKLSVPKCSNQIFSNLFRNNSKMVSITLSNNALTALPSDVFELNHELKRIDLSVNKFTQITFEILHLYNIEVLDLRGNAIEYLNRWSMHQIDMLYENKQKHRTTTDDKAFSVDLRDNDFSCKCHSIDFIKWFINSPVFGGTRYLYHCKADDNLSIPMDKGAIEAAQYDCGKPEREVRRLLLSVLLPCVSTGLFVCLAIVALKRYKRHRKYRRLREHIALIHEGHLGYKVPVFLSYASEDGEFVEPNILTPLETHLKNLTDSDRDFVATGDQYFRLGRSIFSEIIRMLEECAIFIVVLSKNYCHSDYCKHEIEQARLMRKPIVVIMTEFVEEGEMNDVIKETFKHFTRATFKFQEETYRLDQSWEFICESIIQLL